MNRAMIPCFPADTYDTPENTSRYVLDRLINTRWSLYLRYFGVVIKAWSVAIRNHYDDVQWVESSLAIFRHVERCGGRFHLSGMGNLRRDDKLAPGTPRVR